MKWPVAVVFTFAALVHIDGTEWGLGRAAHAQIHVDWARIACVDMPETNEQPHGGNLTAIVGHQCNGRSSCPFKTPTPQQYQRQGVVASSRAWCSQAMEITYDCGDHDPQTVFVPGNAWEQPPAQLQCNVPRIRPGTRLPAGQSPIQIVGARIGCLDVQRADNLTQQVKQVCDNRPSCFFHAPPPDAYRRDHVSASTRASCTQAMEIRYRCGDNDVQTVRVDGDAWTHLPAQMRCDGSRIATNRQDVTPPPQHMCSATDHVRCESCPSIGPPEYFIAPKDMLDWTPTETHHWPLLKGFNPPAPATPGQYASPLGGVPGAPGSTLGANEGRLRTELRRIAARKDAEAALCAAAVKFTLNRPASPGSPSDSAFGNAFADLAVTGRHAFTSFIRAHPTVASLTRRADCRGATQAGITAALDRAYRVASALRGPHDVPARTGLGWIAVSGEDDQPYLPVNVPSAPFPTFLLGVDVPWNNLERGIRYIRVGTRFMIAHRPGSAPAFPRASRLLVDGGPGHQLPRDPLPALADDADVILFIHGMDSRLEEAVHLAEALHRLPTRNWTVISMDLPTSGYADNLDHQNISSLAKIACHSTPLLDFEDAFVQAFVEALDHELHGRLKPRIRAVVGGSLGGSLAMRLGRRSDLSWIPRVGVWSPASIWPSKINRGGTNGCDTSFTLDSAGVKQALEWVGNQPGYLAQHETATEGLGLRRELFYGGFEYDNGWVAGIVGSEDRPSPEQRLRKLIEGSVVRHEWDPFERALGRKKPIEGMFVRGLEAAGEERVGTRDRELRC